MSLALVALALLGSQDTAKKELAFPTAVFDTLLPSGANRKPADLVSQELSGTAVGLLIWRWELPPAVPPDALDKAGIRSGCNFSHHGDPYLACEFVATDEDEQEDARPKGLPVHRHVSKDRWIKVASGPEVLRSYARLSKGPSVLARLKAQGDLPGPMCLVEVEVNDGFGSPRDTGSLVITRLKSLEGGPGFELKAESAWLEALRLHEERLAAQKEAIERLIAPLRSELVPHFAQLQEKARARGIVVSGGENKGFPRLLTGDAGPTATYTYATWLPERRLLQVNWFTRRIEGDCATGTWHDGKSEVPPRWSSWGVAFGVEIGESYFFDTSGKLVERRDVEPLAFQKIIPPR